MSGSSPPPDNSMQIEMMKEQQAREAKAAEDAKAAQHTQDLSNLRASSRASAGNDVRNFFAQQGIDPGQYGGSIDAQLNAILGGISPSDENPGGAFANAGQTVWDTLQAGERTKAGNALNKYFSPNYATSRAPTTLDDSYWAGIEGEQYNDADKIIQNMLSRGVLTSSGYAAAQADLLNQRPGVRSKLDTIGNDLIGKEQQSLNDIVNRARADAGNLTLGTAFDPASYSGEADQQFNSFLAGLGDAIRGQVPGKLYQTAGLAAIGGAGQGAGNTAYNPSAAAGVKTDDTTDPNKTQSTNPNSIF
jgi:hypothetical protein